MLTVSPKTVVNFYNGTDESVPYKNIPVGQAFMLAEKQHRRVSIYADRFAENSC